MIAIFEQGTLSKAAKSLGVSQPTLSSFLSVTEQRLGKTLFIRQQKSMILTEAGRIYLDACQRIVETKKRTYNSIFGLSDNYSERFTVGVTPHRGSTLFARIYSKFYQRYSGVFVGLKEGYIGTLLDSLESGELDLVIGGVSDDMLDRYSAIIHNREELLLCVPDFHPLAALAQPEESGFNSIDIRRFQDTPFVMWGNKTANSHTIWKLFQETGISPTVVYESNNVLFIDSILSSGAGVGFLPIGYCKSGQNRVYFSMEPSIGITVGIYYRRGESLSEAQRYFAYLSIRDQLLREFTTISFLNDEARKIYNEFKETDDGYETT
ncbi:MAG: LysR family transcriptional regulator [Oscillospiraceae bacterium]